ncbi:MAG: ribosome-associated translation inhibitor RaiA [bacterium]
MQVHIHSKHITIRENLKEYAEERIGKLQKIYPEISTADIAFTRRSKHNAEDKYKVEVTLHAHGAIVRAEEDSTSPFAAMDFVAEKLERQLKRFKGKLYHNLSREAKRQHPRSHATELAALEKPEPVAHPNGHAIHNGEIPVVVDDQDEIDEALDEGLPVIVRSKAFHMKPMSAAEATLQMELIGHDFYVFLNPDSEQMNVVYRRHDGNYGLIEPELVSV